MPQVEHMSNLTPQTSIVNNKIQFLTSNSQAFMKHNEIKEEDSPKSKYSHVYRRGTRRSKDQQMGTGDYNQRKISMPVGAVQFITDAPVDNLATEDDQSPVKV